MPSFGGVSTNTTKKSTSSIGLWEAPRRGGTGFHDIKVFNKALLAKQLKRIFTNPNSLVAIILKEKYFKGLDLMGSDLMGSVARPNTT